MWGDRVANSPRRARRTLMRGHGMSMLRATLAVCAVTGLVSVTSAYAAPLTAGPNLSSAGETLRWTPVPNAIRYRIREVTAAGVEVNFYVGEQLTFTPPVVAERVTLKVKSRLPYASQWSNAVTLVS